jgi:hypothetical protein
MMKRHILEKFSPFPEDHIHHISDAHLIMYTIDQLVKSGFPASLAYISLASLTLFPDRFALDSSLKEYPHSHLIHVILEQNPDFLEVSSDGVYRLNAQGKDIAQQTSALLIETIKDKPLVSRKLEAKHPSTRYSELQIASVYSKYLLDQEVELHLLFEHYHLDPLSGQSELKKVLKDIHSYAQLMSDRKMTDFIKKALKQLDENI